MGSPPATGECFTAPPSFRCLLRAPHTGRSKHTNGGVPPPKPRPCKEARRGTDVMHDGHAHIIVFCVHPTHTPPTPPPSQCKVSERHVGVAHFYFPSKMSSPPAPKVVIIGGGPTGLGAAVRLTEVRYPDWVLYESADHPGGLSQSFRDPNGFLWDVGVHVFFSHYPYVDDLMDRALDNWNHLQRECHILVCGNWVPYPLQLNIHRLPPAERDRCWEGLLEAQTHKKESSSPKGDEMYNLGDEDETFEASLLASMGTGIVDVFMRPYNYKVWAVQPTRMSSEWTKERVAAIDLDRIRATMKSGVDDVGWGPNSTFRFPQSGGTGAIYQGVYDRMLAKGHCHFGASSRVTGICPLTRTITFAGGEKTSYDVVLSTMPLDEVLRMVATSLEAAPASARTGDWAAFTPTRLRQIADSFLFNRTHVIGLGMRGKPPAKLATSSWLYFADPAVPFYRGTIFSNYAADNVPEGCWSVMLEVGEHPVHKPVVESALIEDCVRSCRAIGLLTEDEEVVDRYHYVPPRGYPIPFLGRNKLLREVQPWLRDCCGIYSRGRFGGWRYEAGNQDHSIMQGVEAMDDWLLRHKETALASCGRQDVTLRGGEPTYEVATDMVEGPPLRLTL